MPCLTYKSLYDIIIVQFLAATFNYFAKVDKYCKK